LKKVAAIIRESFDQDCSSYRIGGDEFYVLCKNCDREKLDHQLHGLTSRLSHERKNNSHLPTVAYGRSISQTEMTDIQVMLNAADAEMYAFKQQQKERGSADAVTSMTGKRRDNIH
jgi:diguanylate cyclase (GGDEF)-like protein